VPLTGLRSFSRAVAISTIWVRKDTDRPSTVAVSRTRRACRRGYRPPAPPGTGSSDHRLVFEVLSGTRAAPEPAVSSRSVCWSCGAGWVRRRTRHSVPPIRAGAGPAGKATKSGVGELLAMRPGGRLLPRPALVGSAITCSQERSLRATCAARAARPGRPRRRRRGGGWCGGSGLPRPPGWPRRAPGSWGGSAKSQAIVLNARCMRDERRLAGR